MPSVSKGTLVSSGVVLELRTSIVRCCGGSGRFCPGLEDRLTLFPNGCLQTLHKLHKLQNLKTLRGRVHCHNSEIKMYDRRCKIWGNNKRTKDGPFDGLRVGHLMGHSHHPILATERMV